ncbi:16S rRNA (cytosine(1407)-C(5))-methyltransferase RsmF [Vibrio sp. JC009]|uniref:16S rRNA (cytosine(1407)-C(5))-methyltransferase RsmF n=1 Tax=Vibrio sp. JC009 TaxID=2912314 RepID=UPI0023AF2CC4|nr:16S rRNA (cytosine(1407)-C(5))-methyltransferase RsmF [Vibrio sp. JC009]WED23157.1 16S rRNA (cytosine(1407)-C(5))-methyltransferase RsmF [Vibrio sp. JC009]
MHENIKLPEGFLTQIEEIMPSHLSMDEFIAACKRPLRRSIRVNTLKISVNDFLARAAEKGWKLTPVPWCDTGFWIERDENDTTPLGNTAEHMAGLFYIQEASSMMPVTALLFEQQEAFNTVLDVAAAPGSKTTQIAAAMNNNGALVANEFSASRIKGLYSNIQRCGVRNVALTNFDGRVFGGWLPEQFDAILLDAPCSGEGTIRKDADAMNNWSKESIQEIAHTQKDLIESAFHALKPGGVIVYSTCTLNLEENQQVCHHIKEKFGDKVEFERLDQLFPNASDAITEDGFLHIYPQIFDSEGFFVARIRKLASDEAPTVKKRLGKFPFDKASNKIMTDIQSQLNSTLGISLPESADIWLRDNEVWLFPSALQPMIGEIRFDRMGVKLAESHKKGYRWQHEAVMALADGSEEKSVELSIEQAREWYMGRDIRPENLSGKGEVIIKFAGDIIGLGKWVGNRIKNGLPRELVRDGNLF